MLRNYECVYEIAINFWFRGYVGLKFVCFFKKKKCECLRKNKQVLISKMTNFRKNEHSVAL